MKSICITIDKEATGEKIRELMDRSGMSVRELSDYMGFVSMQSVYHWMSGRNIPSIDNLLILSDLWDVPINDIICYRVQRSQCADRREAPRAR